MIQFNRLPSFLPLQLETDFFVNPGEVSASGCPQGNNRQAHSIKTSGPGINHESVSRASFPVALLAQEKSPQSGFPYFLPALVAAKIVKTFSLTPGADIPWTAIFSNTG